MNVLQNGAHSMRIIALPLSRIKASQGTKVHSVTDFNAHTMLVFYRFDLISQSREGNDDLSWRKKALKSAINKATKLWTGLGQAPKGSWKLWTYELGERVADRIEFEELALAGVDPSLGPNLSSSTASSEQDNKAQRSLPKIPLIYPPSLYPNRLGHAVHPVLAHLQVLLARRGPRHRTRFYLWMLIAPLTFPIAIIPLIPNLPFFFCVWRSWSHYRAYRSSQYLSSLLQHQLIEPNPSLELDSAYASITQSSKISQNSQPHTQPLRSSENKGTIGGTAADSISVPTFGTGESLPRDILLTYKAIPLILEMFRLPKSAAANIHRAIDQAHRRLGKSP